MRMIIAALGLGLVCGPAYAAEPPSTGPAVTDPVICKASPRANSRIQRKVCRKKSVWDAQAEDASGAMRELQSRTITPLCPPSGC